MSDTETLFTHVWPPTKELCLSCVATKILNESRVLVVATMLGQLWCCAPPNARSAAINQATSPFVSPLSSFLHLLLLFFNFIYYFTYLTFQLQWINIISSRINIISRIKLLKRCAQTYVWQASRVHICSPRAARFTARSMVKIYVHCETLQHLLDQFLLISVQ